MGNGSATFDSTKNRYFIELFVAANYDADAAGHQHRWRKSFEFASKILFEATNGRMQFGKISYLNKGFVVDTDDVRLTNIGDKSSTDQGPLPFDGNSTYRPHVMNEPLVMLHECGHYIALLFDEYLSLHVVSRTCQNDPSTHECIMEFAKGFGLRLDDTGVETTPPVNLVNQYCSVNHQGRTGNHQHIENGGSCWQTIQSHYPQLVLPGGPATTSTIQTLEWEVRSDMSKFAMVVPSNAMFSDPIVARALKSAVKQFARHIVFSGDQLAIAIGPNELLRPMTRINLADLAPLYQRIDQMDLGQNGDSQLLINRAIEAFQGQPGAYQTLVLATPVMTYNKRQLATTVASRRISLKANLLGPEAEVDDTPVNKWFDSQTIPLKLAEPGRFAFAIQNELIQTLYAQSPGLGIVDMCLGRLPPATLPLKFSGVPDRNINLEQRDIGFDFPVWIESTTEAVTFLLSEPLQGNLTFTLISPAGQEINQASPQAGTTNNIMSYYLTTQLPGRWILRLTRRGADKVELPFFLVAASKNRHVSTSVQVLPLKSRRVTFRSRLSYDYALDRIQATVEVYRALPDSESPGRVVRSLVLQRQIVLDANDRVHELSKGWYEGELELEPGDYVAHFRWQNCGNAMYISNPNGIVQGEVMEYPAHYIPALTRIVSRRFEVR